MFSGILAGAKTAHQAVDSKLGKPDSATVGTFGKSGERVLLVTAKAVNFPL